MRDWPRSGPSGNLDNLRTTRSSQRSQADLDGRAFRNGRDSVTPKEVLAQIRQSEVTTVDLRFMDFPGVWQHFAIPADSNEEPLPASIGRYVVGPPPYKTNILGGAR